MADKQAFGLRVSGDVAAVLEAEAARQGVSPTTLATRVLEETVRTLAMDAGFEDLTQPPAAEVRRLLIEILAGVRFQMAASFALHPDKAPVLGRLQQQIVDE